MKALKCRECGREYPLTANHVCEFDFGPLEVAYDYDRIKKSLTRAAIQSRPTTMWRYRELLPVGNDPTVGLQVGYTPLVRADRLAKKLGIRELWIKNDAVNYPTLSFNTSKKAIPSSGRAPLWRFPLVRASLAESSMALATRLTAKAPSNQQKSVAST